MRRDVAAGLVLVAVSGALAYHFACCWRYDYFFIYEHNEILLAFETLLVVGIAVFGIERVWHALRKKRQ